MIFIIIYQISIIDKDKRVFYIYSLKYTRVTIDWYILIKIPTTMCQSSFACLWLMLKTRMQYNDM